MFDFSTQKIFFLLLVILAIQRLFELRISKRNEKKILAAGGREHYPRHFLFMKLLHTLWFPAMIVEVIFCERPFVIWLAVISFIFLLLGQSFRYAAIRTLGWRWNVKIMTVPDAAPIDGGIYKYIKHPNYLGVIIEIAAVPLIHCAYLTAALFTIGNAIILKIRISAEEKALDVDNEYEKIFENKPRFIPKQ